jgi:hypothetical protein
MSVQQYTPLIHFNNENNLGLCSYASSNYTVNVGGSINVKSTIYLDGSPLFDASGTATEGFNLKATNIFIRPRIDYAGGVHINRTLPSSNLFHINAGFNANLAVLDSFYNQAQIHFRCTTSSNSGRFSMYRLAQSNEMFILRHAPNSSNLPYVPDTNTGYSNVVSWTPSRRFAADYDINVHGSMNMISVAPIINLSSSTIGHCNGHMYLTTLPSSNVGIGTLAPAYKSHIHVSSSENVPSFGVTQMSSASIFELSNSTDKVVIVTNGGNVGIGTTNPTRKLHVNNGDILVTNGLVSAVSYAFTASPTSSIVNPSDDVMAFHTTGQERLRISNTGAIGIGTSFGLQNAHLTIASSNTNSLVTMYQNGTGDLLRGISSNNTRLVVSCTSNVVGINTTKPTEALHVVGNQVISGNIYPASNESFSLGTSNQRWTDLYLSGTSIDLGGTRISKNENGDIRLVDIGSNTLRSVIGDHVQIGDESWPSYLTIKQGQSPDPIVFVQRDTNTNTDVEFVPFLKSSLSSGISVGVATPEALLHVVGHTSIPTVIFDHDNPSASNIFQVRDNGVPQVVVEKGGNVGIGTTVARAELHVYGSNASALMVTQRNLGGNVAAFMTQIDPVVITGEANVGIATAVPIARLHVAGTQFFDGQSTFTEKVYMGKDLEVQGNNITHGDQTTDSDIRLKTDIQRISGALDKLCTLSGYTFMKNGQTKRSTGLIAQEVAAVIPEAVIENQDTGFLSLAYGNLAGLIIESIKELREEVRALKTMAF